MSASFHERIERSLSDADLQAALDANADKRIAVRQQAFASIPDYQQRRQRAHDVRSEVIQNLDEYLAAFLRRVAENGIMVHRAANAAQAVQIVLEIARQKHARLIAKSKTMVSEEINLNHALEAQGLRVVETDLGEFIIQLRGEPPSHIITPAVHLRRAQVGETFHEKLGMPYTDSIPEMTQAARQTLRQIFLSADIGLSGVNFGVVESGALCLLTNEGNGRMVTTVPDVHIALMGIERLVPTLDDLALMLSLLPRSATGQKMTVYASLIHSPRQPGEVDGPRVRHLIVVDNGRNALRQTPLAEILYCIRCGACLNACPVFREIGGHAYVGKRGENSTYPGPVGSVLSPALFGQAEFAHLARASSLCGACREACPVDIDLPRLLLRVRAGGVNLGADQAPASAPGFLKQGLRVFGWAAVAPWRYRLAQRLAGFFSRLVSPFSPWLRLPAFTGWGFSKDFPRPAIKPFSDWMSHREKTSGDSTVQSAAKATLTPFSPDAAHQDEQFPLHAAVQQVDLVTTFKRELEALDGVFTVCQLDELGERLLALLRERNIEHILAWEQDDLPDGLLAYLIQHGIRCSHQPNADLQAGLTGALAGVAETATLLLPAGRGKPLTASLLPPLHMAVLRAEHIYPHLQAALKLPEVRLASSLAMISGPSRTADIEMTLTLGVHGPKEVHVFCVLTPASESASKMNHP